MQESCNTYTRVMSRIWMSDVTHMKESCHTYERVISHIWISHVLQVHIYEWVMSHICELYIVTYRTYECVTYRSYEWYVRTCVRTYVHVVHIFICRIYEWCHKTCCIVHMYVSYIYSYVGYMSDVTQHVVSYIWMCYVTNGGVMSHKSKRGSHVTHLNESCHT